MKKPSMLYASPFTPMKSGISDYSEILVDALSSKYEISLLIDDYELENPEMISKFDIFRYGIDDIAYEKFDYLVYNIGNHPGFHTYIYECCLQHPGMVILHDFAIYFLTVGIHQHYQDVLKEIYKQAGAKGIHMVKQAMLNESTDLLECKSLANQLPLNEELLKSNNKFMVHSEYAYNQVVNTGFIGPNNIRKINHIALIDENTKYRSKEDLYKKFGIPQNAIVLASFGYISATKLNHTICKMIKTLQISNQNICYVMVGEGNYVDDYVDNQSVYKTGYTELDEFNSFIKYADIILNLRHPTMGETSGALIRILGLGKVCVINDEGWFAEIPDDCAIKVSVQAIEDELPAKIEQLIDNHKIYEQYQENAKRLINSEYSSKIIVEQIADFLEC